MDFCFETFSRLKERRRPLAGSRILLVDEPSVGLAPILVARMIDKITELTAALGLTVLMAEQNFEQATRIAARGYVLVHGRVILAADSVAALRSSEVVRRLYLGTGGGSGFTLQHRNIGKAMQIKVGREPLPKPIRSCRTGGAGARMTRSARLTLSRPKT